MPNWLIRQEFNILFHNVPMAAGMKQVSQFVSTPAKFPRPVARASKIPDFLSEAESCLTFSLEILNYIVACSQNIATGRQRTVSTQSDARGLTFPPRICGLPVRDSAAAAVAAKPLYSQDTTTTVDLAITHTHTHTHDMT